MTTDAMTFTDYHVLTIYDENGEAIKTFNIDKINETPKADELAVLYTYRTNIHKDDDGILMIMFKQILMFQIQIVIL
ncbi:MAG: hypothetical protein ACLU5J_02090 [Christensenellales bacterium]